MLDTLFQQGAMFQVAPAADPIKKGPHSMHEHKQGLAMS